MRGILILAVLAAALGVNGCGAASNGVETPRPSASPATLVSTPAASPSPGDTSVVPALTGTAPALPTQPQTVVPTIQPVPTLDVKSSPVNSNPIMEDMIQQARRDLAARLLVSADSIVVKKADAAEWRDTSLGCPQPGVMYAQVITPGYLIVLAYNGKDYEYHASERRVILCEKTK